MNPVQSSMQTSLKQLREGTSLSREAMAAVVGEIMAGSCDPAQIGALLMALAIKGETTEEIVGAAMAMRAAVTPIRSGRGELLDTCGTGGSGIARRNVSTAVGLVVAACGTPVAKHGNRAATSRSGSADVLEALGVAVDASPQRVERCIDEVGIGFLFAAALHPAMRYAMGPRKALGIRTIFNLLGPLTNPAGATRQLLGVYDPSRCEDLARALGALGSRRVLVVHGFAAGVTACASAAWGIDDLSVEGETLVAQYREGTHTCFVLRPQQAGLEPFSQAGIAGGTPEENAQALRELLAGVKGPYRDAVLYSSAVALMAASEAEVGDLPRLVEQAATAIDDGQAARVLSRLVELSHGRG